jgi:hypothetical protein
MTVLRHACEEARQEFERVSTAHPLRKVLTEALKTHGKRHAYVKQIKQQLTHQLDHHPAWQKYQNSWLALKQAGGKPELQDKKRKRNKPHANS